MSAHARSLPVAGARRRLSGRALVALAVAVWALAGVAGAWRYAEMYLVYRGFPVPVTPRGVPTGRVVQASFVSRALGRRAAYLAYLPPQYARWARHGRGFPVLYLLHPPPGRASIFFTAGALAVDANVLIHEHRIRPLIAVVPNGRTSAYGNDTEWTNARAGRYEDFVLDVVHAVDRRYATVADRRHRVIGGLSEGGYGAVNIALHHLRTFAGVQSWSGYFLNSARYSPVLASETPGQVAYNSPLLRAPHLAPSIRRLGLRAFLYTGRSDPEIGGRELRPFAATLARAGAQVRSAVYPGGHDWALWRAQMPHMLEVANAWFHSPPGRSAPTSSLTRGR
jgi:enterochelin esterase-like enzyme